MKKLWFIIIPIILIGVAVLIWFLISPKTIEPFYLDDEYYDKAELIDIDGGELNILEEEDKSFIVFLYQASCSTSYDFSENIEEFSNTYEMTFYRMLFTEIKDTDIASYVKYCPSAVIYQKGKIVAYLDASSDEDTAYFNSVSEFKTWLTKYVLLK